MPSHINKKTVARNTLMLYLRMGVMMLVSLYTSRVILATLGVDDFGIYNVVGSVVVMFSFMNLTLTVSIRRFLAYELGKGENNNIQSVFNSSVIAVLLASVIIFVALETGGLWFLNFQLNIPIERLDAANFAFQFSVLSFFLSMNAVPYSSAIVAYEKMGVYAYIGIIEVTLKLLLVILLQYIPGDKLRLYCIMTFSLSLFTTSFNFIYCKLRVINTTTLFPFRWADVSAIFKFSAWSVLGTLIFMMATQGVNMIFNIFFGVAINAALGVAQQVSNAINQFIGNFQTAFNPQLTKSYSAEGLSENTFRFVCQTSRFSIILILILGVPIIANIDPLLSLWLGKVPYYSAQFAIISVLYISIDGSAGPLYLLVYAKGDVKTYQLVLSSIQIAYVILVLLLCYSGFSPDLVLTASIVNVLFLYIGRIVILRIKMNFPVKTYFKDVLRPLLLPVLIFISVAYILNNTSLDCSLFWILSRILLTALLVAGICYILYLDREEKRFIISTIKKRINRHD